MAHLLAQRKTLLSLISRKNRKLNNEARLLFFLFFFNGNACDAAASSGGAAAARDGEAGMIITPCHRQRHSPFQLFNKLDTINL